MHRAVFASLKAWKARASRKPLIIRGARQIGKTTAIEKFAEVNFESVIKINFELQTEYKACFSKLDPTSIMNAIVATSGKKITFGKTLLFLDEIQECPNALKSLRYFKELMPDLHVICAGSLLEFTLREEGFRMPVGRVESIYMHPLSFQEFLVASGYSELQRQLNELTPEVQLNPAVETKALELLREYFVTGGMPEIVANYLKNKDLAEVKLLQASVMDTYRRDFGKYTKGTRINYVKTLFERAPSMVGKHFKYAQIDAHMKSRELKPALADLVDAGVITQAFCTTASGLPLNATKNEKKFKIIFLDVGLVKFVSQLDAKLMLEQDLTLLDRGSLAEQFVGQELITYPPDYYPREVFYWEREKVGSTAEVDYVLNVDKQIIPVEVKAGKTGSLKSMQVFLNEKKLPFGVRISTKPLSFHKRILSVPLYMVHELPRLVSNIS